MIETFTKNDAVRFIYNETSEEENQQIEIEKILNAEMSEFIDDMSLVKEELNHCELSLSKKAMNNIMNEARNLSRVAV